MAAKDRIQAIKQMVANDKKVTVSNLSGIFQVTEETIRRDLEKLEDEGFLTRTYGGAVLNYSDVDGEYPFL
ncbi:DeoR-family transcriptional regulator [Escherichia coli]|uniref:DeoR-family transcriptional regulator n=1 Tax=Escherichia coli TaxID=562 RepID=A0A377K7M5_ECOLX|nr:DeoR-family transcriptional regulator [Escherichia coli]